MSTNNETLEGQLREIYGRVAYTQKTHEKMADQVLGKYKLIKSIEIACSALSASSLILAVFGEAKTGTVIGAIFSTILLGLLLYFKEANLGELANKHAEAASKLWGVRERLLSALVDLRRNSNAENATEIRDEVNEELESIYRAAPRTNGKAYAAAQKGLKMQEELFFSDDELDHLLPKQLRSTHKRSSTGPTT
jgi:hypothetical protein